MKRTTPNRERSRWREGRKEEWGGEEKGGGGKGDDGGKKKPPDGTHSSLTLAQGIDGRDLEVTKYGSS